MLAGAMHGMSPTCVRAWTWGSTCVCCAGMHVTPALPAANEMLSLVSKLSSVASSTELRLGDTLLPGEVSVSADCVSAGATTSSVRPSPSRTVL